MYYAYTKSTLSNEINTKALQKIILSLCQTLALSIIGSDGKHSNQ